MRIHSLFAVLLVAGLAFVFAGCSDDDENNPAGAGSGSEETGALVGTVTDSVSGEPVPQATIVVHTDPPVDTTADDDGEYLIPEVKVGVWTVTATGSGYGSWTDEAEIVKDDTTTLDAVLPPSVPVPGVREAQIDATSYTDFTRFNLETGEVVDGGTAAADDWHIAFRRYEVKLNGGASGELGVRACDLAELGHEHGMDFEQMNEMPTLSDEDWTTDSESLVFTGWYDYDPETHEVSPNGRVFAVRDAAGAGYAKAVVEDLTDAGMGALASVTLKYVYDPEGTDLSGAVDTVTVEDGDGDNNLYFSFADGAVGPDAIWDLWFEGFDARINGGVSGDGDAGVYPAYDDPDYDEFPEFTSAPPDMGGSYQQDSMHSALTDWYDYNGQTHEVTSMGHVYLIDTGTTVFKFEITNYYKVIEGSPVGGWISLRYQEM